MQTAHPSPCFRFLARLPSLALLAALVGGCAGKFMERGPNPAFCDSSRVFSAVDGVVGAGALVWGLQVDMDRMANDFTFKRLEDGSLGGGYDALQLAVGIALGTSFLVEAGRSYKAANRCRRILELQAAQSAGATPDARRDTVRHDPFRRR